jgi:hypothetical protein
MPVSPVRQTKAARSVRKNALRELGILRRGMIELAWRFLVYQKDSELVHNPEFRIMPSN